jgi:ATP-binding cassette subfamily B (MDR/TAP) protein 6
MFQFCPTNASLSQPWVNHGLSPCFVDTVFSSIQLAFITLFGGVQLFFFNKYATRTETNLVPKSALFNLQLWLTALFPVLEAARQGTVYLLKKEYYGYDVLHLVALAYSFYFSFYLLWLERYYMLPTVPIKGHGLVLLIFWTIIFVKENLTFLNLRGLHWWFTLKE